MIFCRHSFSGPQGCDIGREFYDSAIYDSTIIVAMQHFCCIATKVR
jgi:hypothetical protein